MRLSLLCLFFFFSSRRRHTRFDCDWSSDVCSSDLAGSLGIQARLSRSRRPARSQRTWFHPPAFRGQWKYRTQCRHYWPPQIPPADTSLSYLPNLDAMNCHEQMALNTVALSDDALNILN